MFFDKQKQSTHLKRLAIREDSLYKILLKITKVMDRYYLDPIIGLIPGLGDVFSSIFVIPFLYISIFKIGSIPLTLALLSNILLDIILGLVPFWVGDVVDVFNRAYDKNMRLIKGFVEEDNETVKRINKRAIMMVFFIIIALIIIYYMLKTLAFMGERIMSLFT